MNLVNKVKVVLSNVFPVYFHSVTRIPLPEPPTGYGPSFSVGISEGFANKSSVRLAVRDSSAGGEFP